jgi:hypothetical protein
VDPRSPADIIRLPSTFEEQTRVIENLKGMFIGVQGPGELDAITEKAGMPASLLNFYLASHVDLSWINLGTAVYIPVEITQREGGRKSVFFLDQGEEVLAGIYVTSEGLALRFVKRVTGSSLPAQFGDVYSTRITNRDGDLVFEGQEKLWAFDPQTGEGHFTSQRSTEQHAKGASATANATSTSTYCLWWSLVRYEPDHWS